MYITVNQYIQFAVTNWLLNVNIVQQYILQQYIKF